MKQSALDKLSERPLRIGISTRALFDLSEEHRIFVDDGVGAYEKYQLEHENDVLAPGVGFPLVSRLLALNSPDAPPYVEVIFLSQNSPDLSLRAFKSAQAHELGIKTGSFTSGQSLAPYLKAWGIDLFLSNKANDVREAVQQGVAAAHLREGPNEHYGAQPGEVRVAFDGDAVIFSGESDQIFVKEGIEEFLDHEVKHATNPMDAGPFGPFMKKLSLLRAAFLDDLNVSKVRIAIVTARNAPAHARVVHTLRSWGTPADEAHFVGKLDKGPILASFGAHIFFDDQVKHVKGAAPLVPSGHVPGPHHEDVPVIPAG